MAAAYRRGKTWTIRVPRQGKPAKAVGTGTSDKATAAAMRRVVELLGDMGRWTLLDALTSGPVAQRLTLMELLAAHRANRLDELEARLKEPDLRAYVPGWEAYLATTLKSDINRTRYINELHTLVAVGEGSAPFPVSRFLDPEVLHTWIHRPPERPWMAKGGVSLRWQRKTIASSFAKYLLSLKVIRHNPLRDLPALKKPTGRDRWLPQAEVQRYVNAFAEPHRTIAAIREGAGAEIGAVLALRRGDVDLEQWMLRLRGTKTRDRDREARVFFAWARPIIAAYVAAHPMHPDALLFEGVQYHHHERAHRDVCTALRIDDYHVHDARHSFAVGARKLGVKDELIAANLGHQDDVQVKKTYGRYAPDVEDWEEAEGQARAAQARRARKDARQRGRMAEDATERATSRRIS